MEIFLYYPLKRVGFKPQFFGKKFFLWKRSAKRYSAFHMDRLQLVWATQKHFSTPYSLLPTLSAKNNFVVYSNEKRCKILISI